MCTGEVAASRKPFGSVSLRGKISVGARAVRGGGARKIRGIFTRPLWSPALLFPLKACRPSRSSSGPSGRHGVIQALAGLWCRAEQAGNPSVPGTSSQRIGNPSHDTGTPAQVCSGQVTRTGHAARPSGSPRALPALRMWETEQLVLMAHGHGTQAIAQRCGFW